MKNKSKNQHGKYTRISSSLHADQQCWLVALACGWLVVACGFATVVACGFATAKE